MRQGGRGGDPCAGRPSRIRWYSTNDFNFFYTNKMKKL